MELKVKLKQSELETAIIAYVTNKTIFKDYYVKAVTINPDLSADVEMAVSSASKD